MSIAAGATQQFTATGTYSDGTTKNLTASATWTSSATGVATVNSSGLATGVAAGSTTIQATSGGVSGSTTLTVTGAAPALTSIAISPASPSVSLGATVQLTATGTYSDNSTQNLTSTANWSSSATGTATVSGTGLVTGIASGSATITAAVGNVSQTALVTVTSTSSRPLGTATLIGPATCPSNSAPGATCTNVNISCTGLPDIMATLAVVTPVGTPKGTVILHEGGAGTSPLNNGFPASYTAAGYNAVEVVWATEWSNAQVGGLGAGILPAACRPATIFNYIFSTVHGSSRTAGFCGQGISGGGATFSYSIAHYGLDSLFDHVVIAAGPAVARLDYGCDPAIAPTPTNNLCPLLTAAPFSFGGNATHIDVLEGTSSCKAASPLAADVTKWTTDSIVSSTANFNFPKTSMAWFECVTQPVNESTGQARYLIDAVNPKNAPVPVSCYSGICSGEGVWQDPTAYNDTVTDMTTNCVPNH